MFKWFFYGFSLVFLTACGDGYAGGEDDLPPELMPIEDDVTISILGGPESSVRSYIAKSGMGNASFSVDLRKGINIIKFSHVSFYDEDKNRDALFSLKKKGKPFYYITQKSLEKLADTTTVRDTDIGKEETYTVSIDVPGQKDKWELYFIAKADLDDDVESYFPDAVEVSKEGRNDILYKYQWHLKNNGANEYTVSDAIEGNDINVEDVWENYTGKGVTVAVIDQGIEINHPDLIENIDIGQSWNYLTKSLDTTPVNLGNAHGTAVAGIVAASAKNGIGGRGVAPDASLVSFNVLESQGITNWQLPLESLVRGIDENSIDIFNNSWGPANPTVYPNYHSTLDNPYYQYANQLAYGTMHGRGGKGAIYVKSAGNDRCRLDNEQVLRPYWNANLNPEQVERFVIVVGASKADGSFSAYSTPGANLLLNAPGGYIQLPYLEVDQHLVVTTDLSGKLRGYDYQDSNLIDYHFDARGNENYDYTDRMNGTSAAGPIVSGVVALMLEANPLLRWRDIRYILATTATKNGTGYVPNNAGYSFSSTYGFGRVNAKKAVEKAIGWSNLPGEVGYGDYFYKVHSLNDANDKNLSKASRILSVFDSHIDKIEYVNLELSIKKVESENLTFDNGNNGEQKLEGYYNFDFKMSDINDTATKVDVLMTCGDVMIFENVRITSGSAGIKGDILHEFFREQCRVYFDFDNGATEGEAKWSLKLSKGKPLPEMSQLKITLTSPGGTPSVLLNAPNGVDNKAKFISTRFGSNAFLDESADGDWILKVEETRDFKDQKDENDRRAFIIEDIRLDIYGR